MFRHQSFRSGFWCTALLATVIAVDGLAMETGVRPEGHVQRDGVTIEAYSRNGHITFCFGADKGVKIASEYGIEFKVPHGQAKLWNEALPKIVTGKQPYFDLPVRVDLKTRGAPHGRQVSIGLGVCVDAMYCTPLSFDMTVLATSSGSGSPGCIHD